MYIFCCIHTHPSLHTHTWYEHYFFQTRQTQVVLPFICLLTISTSWKTAKACYLKVRQRIWFNVYFLMLFQCTGPLTLCPRSLMLAGVSGDQSTSHVQLHSRKLFYIVIPKTIQIQSPRCKAQIFYVNILFSFTVMLHGLCISYYTNPLRLFHNVE